MLKQSIYLALAVAAATPVWAELRQADHTPWSGYWWPLRSGGLLEPLKRYDVLTGSAAAPAERERLDTGEPFASWHGYCHGWAAAAVLEPEPQRSRIVRDAEGKLRRVRVGDLKGLLTAAHAGDVSNIYGDRYGDGVGDDNPHDLNPVRLWELLRLHVDELGVPLILDIESGPEVWNYPAYAYEVHLSPEGEGVRSATMTVLLADNAVPPGYVGVRTRRLVYTFRFTTVDGEVDLESAEWTGTSVTDHPDFAWYPYAILPENPEVDYAVVRQLVGRPLEEGQDVELESRPDAEQETPAESTVAATQARPDPVDVSPYELVELLATPRSDFVIDAVVDRFDGGVYREGDSLSVRVASEHPGYLYLLQVDRDGAPSLLYPQPGDDNRLPADDAETLPRPDSGYRFEVAAPTGVDRIKAVVTSRPLRLSGLLTRPATQGQGPLVAVPRRFHWHPAQRQQTQKFLAGFPAEGARGVLKGRQANTPSLSERIGAIAVDETVFVVEPRAEAPGADPRQSK